MLGENHPMTQEAWRAYLELALGMTEASRKKATKAVKRLVGKGGATAEQLHVLAEELVRTSAANREGLARMIRVELDRALLRLGLANGDEVTALEERVRQLEEQLRAAAAPEPVEPAADPGPVGVEVASSAPVKRTAAKRVAAKKVAAEQTATRAAAKTTTRAAAPKATAKKAVAKKATARKTAAQPETAVDAQPVAGDQAS
jgi:polyhydroxyalkanoate synthesis regulator phasin